MKINLIERKPYMQTLRDLRNHQIIKVVTGVRRSGKSTLLQMLADEIGQTVNAGQIQFYNFEDPDVFAIGNWKAIYDHIKVRLLPDRMNYIFLDEVQHVDTFQRLVDGLFIKKNCDVYITGSNAYLLSGELATLLTGRYIEVHVLPFSFSEYIDFQHVSHLKSPNLTKNESLAILGGENTQNRAKNGGFSDLGGVNPQNFQDLSSFADLLGAKPPTFTKDENLANFIYHGAIPHAVNLRYSVPEQENDFVKAILNTIIEKDIFQRRDVHNKSTFSKILDLFDSIGSYISPNSIVNSLKNDNVCINNETVTGYLNYLTEAYLLYKVPRYDVKGKRLLQTLDKYYLADTGFRKARLGKKMTEDRGHLLENMVYLELRRRNSEVYIGKLRDKEIDFVAMDNKGYVSYYQVAYSVLDEQTLERELAPLRAIRDSNPKYLLSADWDTDPVYDGIRKYNVMDWMLGKD